MGSSLYQAVGQLPPDEVIFGETDAMHEVRTHLQKAARTNVPVLIEGESGTGKDIIAQIIHKASPWADGPYVKVACAAIPSSLLESELFGYEKGAFTGANGNKPGKVEIAHRGTLFLDGIAELDTAIQAKLLQVLQDGHFCSIGATKDKKVEARIICATNRSLEDEIDRGTFRQDLFYRINVINIRLIPLRDRAEDIPELVDYFLEVCKEKYNARPEPIPRDIIVRLQGYDWPGNIRELENFVRRYAILGSEALSELPGDGLPAREGANSGKDDGRPVSLRMLTRKARQQLERDVILKSLNANNWNRKVTARKLNISYRSLLYKIRDAGLEAQASRWSAKIEAARQLECEVIVKSLNAHNWNRKVAAQELNMSYRELLYKIRHAGLQPTRSTN